MRKYFLFLVLVVSLSQSFAVRAARNLEVFNPASRHALVIGNNNYRSVSVLEKAGNDARAMGDALEKIGYQTTVLLDANHRQMNSAINRFVEDIGGGGIGVLFFAGHGVQINNQNFLLPVDLDAPRSEADIDDQTVSLQNIQDKIAQARPRFTLLVIDACRNNPLPRKAGRSLGATRGLALASSAEGQMVIFSAGANQLALDKLYPEDANPNGLFTRELLPWLVKPGVSVRQAILEVRRAVYNKARSVNHDQFPAVYDQVLGDFYFGSRMSAPDSAPPPTPTSTALAPVATSQAAAPAVLPPVAAPLALRPAPTNPAPPPTLTASISPMPPDGFNAPASSAAKRDSLGYAALGLPSRRSFWNGVKRDALTQKMRAAMADAGSSVLEMAPHGLELDAKEFESWWREPETNPRSRELCAAKPAPRALLAARVESPPVFFTDIESAYWPELKMQMIVCADMRTFKQSKTLSPHGGEPWPFATEFGAELEGFLRAMHKELNP